MASSKVGTAAPPASTATKQVDAAIAREEALEKFNSIQWKDYTRSGSYGITEDDAAALAEAEAATASSTSTDATRYGDIWGRVLSLIVCKVTEPTVIRYALARMESLLVDGVQLQSRVDLFTTSTDLLPSEGLLRLIKSGSGYTQYAASQILTRMITMKPNLAQDEMKIINAWIIDSITLGKSAMDLASDPSRASTANAAVSALMVLLRNEPARVLFTKSGGMTLLAELLKGSAGRNQLTYEVCFSLWTLTFCSVAVEEFGSSGALSAVISKMQSGPRDKVIRVCLASLHNLLGKHNGTYNETMIESGLIKMLTTMKERKWSDVDIITDVNAIRDVLLREFKVLTTMERYKKELETRQLTWGLLHTDKFWRENYMAFEEQEFECIKMLISLLEDAKENESGHQDSETVAVALYDLGDFVRFYPNGKMIVKRLGAKKVVMELMADDNPEVRKQALQCMSKMMVNKWEFVK